jgi:hypothetical protein
VLRLIFQFSPHSPAPPSPARFSYLQCSNPGGRGTCESLTGVRGRSPHHIIIPHYTHHMQQLTTRVDCLARSSPPGGDWPEAEGPSTDEGVFVTHTPTHTHPTQKYCRTIAITPPPPICSLLPCSFPPCFFAGGILCFSILFKLH